MEEGAATAQERLDSHVQAGPSSKPAPAGNDAGSNGQPVKRYRRAELDEEEEKKKLELLAAVEDDEEEYVPLCPHANLATHGTALPASATLAAQHGTLVHVLSSTHPHEHREYVPVAKRRQQEEQKLRQLLKVSAVDSMKDAGGEGE